MEEFKLLDYCYCNKYFTNVIIHPGARYKLQYSKKNIFANKDKFA